MKFIMLPEPVTVVVDYNMPTENSVGYKTDFINGDIDTLKVIGVDWNVFVLLVEDYTVCSMRCMVYPPKSIELSVREYFRKNQLDDLFQFPTQEK